MGGRCTVHVQHVDQTFKIQRGIESELWTVQLNAGDKQQVAKWAPLEKTTTLEHRSSILRSQKGTREDQHGRQKCQSARPALCVYDHGNPWLPSSCCTMRPAITADLILQSLNSFFKAPEIPERW